MVPVAIPQLQFGSPVHRQVPNLSLVGETCGLVPVAFPQLQFGSKFSLRAIFWIPDFLSIIQFVAPDFIFFWFVLSVKLTSSHHVLLAYGVSLNPACLVGLVNHFG